MSNTRAARAIAFYLPQYHPIPENDGFWGKGFTEWTNVTRAKPLFRGHLQPRLPANLGYYDLRVPEVRELQADMARHAGIEGFCYWHYWFGNGKRVLDRIFTEVLESGKPDFPFCLAWANESWTGRWHGLNSKIILEQTYPGIQDYKDHFHALLPAFRDPRYIEVEGKKLFVIYLHHLIPDLELFARCWNDLARENGINGFYFVSFSRDSDGALEKPPDLDGLIIKDLFETMMKTASNPLHKMGPYLKRKFRLNQSGIPEETLFPPLRSYYANMIDAWSAKPIKDAIIPCVHPNWDNTPRCGRRGLVIMNSTPDLFRKLVTDQLGKISNRPFENRLFFIKSWNEWAEGNYLEPDRDFGQQYLDALRSCLYLNHWPA